MAADLRRELRAVLAKAGLRADDAALAAEAAERCLRAKRDAVIRAALDLGLSLRRISQLVGVGKSHVQRLRKSAVPRVSPNAP